MTTTIGYLDSTTGQWTVEQNVSPERYQQVKGQSQAMAVLVRTQGPAGPQFVWADEGTDMSMWPPGTTLVSEYLLAEQLPPGLTLLSQADEHGLYWPPGTPQNGSPPAAPQKAPPAPPAAPVKPSRTKWIVGGLVGLVAVVGGTWWWRRGHRPGKTG